MNPDSIVQYMTDWLKEQVGKTKASGVVIGVSGGVDSAVAAVIAKRAFPQGCLAVLLPIESYMLDRKDSTVLVEKFDIPYEIAELDNVYHLLLTQLESHIKVEGKLGQLIRGNLKARLRMLTLYYFAQAHNYLVLGTTNKSEMSIGYTTKYGDSAVDLQLLADLLKSEVFEIARYLQIPRAIINKPPSGGLWAGQTDESEMGITYQQLDGYLRTKKGDPEVVNKVQRMFEISEHKRRMPLICKIPEEIKWGN